MSAFTTQPLPPGYSVEVDGMGARTWHETLGRFADANIYQTWAYEVTLSGARAISHVVLKRHGEVVAAAQSRIVKLPLLRIGVAYIRWGPLWRLGDRAPQPEHLALMLQCLRQEYSVRRGLAVRLMPYLHENEAELFRPVLGAAGFERLEAEVPQRTLLVSIQQPLAPLRAGLEQKWRNGLNKAERNGLSVEEGTDEALFDRFIAMHAEMRERKGLASTSNVRNFRDMQRALPEPHKMRVLLASSQGEPAAGIVCSKVGDFGTFLHGATTNAGMRTNASYLLQWRALCWLKEQGAVSYNLHGINPVTNPGTHRFKAGLCGRNGVDVRYLGTYEFQGAGPAHALVRLATRARTAYRNRHAAPSIPPPTRLDSGARQ